MWGIYLVHTQSKAGHVSVQQTCWRCWPCKFTKFIAHHKSSFRLISQVHIKLLVGAFRQDQRWLLSYWKYNFQICFVKLMWNGNINWFEWIMISLLNKWWNHPLWIFSWSHRQCSNVFFCTGVTCLQKTCTSDHTRGFWSEKPTTPRQRRRAH